MTLRSATIALIALATGAAASHAAPRPFVAPFYSFFADPYAYQPKAVAVADFNGDGLMDAAMPCYVGPTVAVMLGRSDGTWGLDRSYVTAQSGLCIAAGDLNGDGKPDLVVGSQTDTVSVLINNGDGTFKPRVAYVAAGWAFGVALGDVNGDGRLDVLVADYSNTSKLSVWLNTGAGVLGPRADVLVGYNPRTVALGDLNHDGKLDAFVGGEQAAILIGAGNGTFTSTVTSISMRYGALADIDGDGNLDAVGTGGYPMIYLRGLGDGTFAAPVYYSSTNALAQTVLADVDRDGRPDAITLLENGSQFAIWRNEGAGAFGPPHRIRTGIVAAGIAMAVPAPGGHLSAFVAGLNSNSLLVHPGNGDSTFVLAPERVVATISTSSVRFARLTGGPFPDIVVTNGTPNTVCTVFPSTGPATHGPAIVVPRGGGRYTNSGFALGDLDGDGLPDIVASQAATYPNPAPNTFGVVLNQGGGSFGSETDYVMPNQGSNPHIAIGDFTGDGKQDVVVLASSGPLAPQLLLYPGDGHGHLGVAQVLSGTYYVDFGFRAVDLNGDGHADLVIGRSTEPPTLTFLPGDGAGAFGAPVTLTVISHGYKVAIGDLNGDGKADLAISTTSGGVSTMLGNGSFGFGTRRDIGIGSSTGSIQISDIDGDGKQDVIVGNSQDLFSYLHGHGDGTFDDRQDYAGSYVIAEPADVNGDGTPDLALGQAGDFRNSVTLVLNGVGTLAAPSPVARTLALAAAPNPACLSTTLRWSMPAAGRATVRVLDVTGREVARPFDAVAPAGLHAAQWNGAGAAPGIYFAELVTATGHTTTRLAIVH